VSSSLQSALTPLLQGAAAQDPQVAALLQQFGGAQQAAAFLAGTTSEQIGQGPVGVVQPDQSVLPGTNSGAVGGLLSYRNFGNVQYWGIDASVQVQATDRLDAFANVSIVSDDFFDNDELDEEETSLSLALNAPSFKAKGGLDYRFEGVGLSVGASGNYVEGFPVETGPYVGEVEDYFLLDARLGYDLPPISGLSANLTVKNVLNNEHREFVGAPELGRMIMARLTYELP
jgi:iron complex outermembrane receptor protein